MLYNTIIILFLSLHSAVFGDDFKLKQIHVLFRHGERSPTSSYEKDPHKKYKWEGGLGQLTNRGKFQMYSLGASLRKYYHDFLPVHYWPSDVNFTSSSLDRCLMSAELLGAGLFPPKGFQIWNPDLLWQPIPIHYLPRNIDNLLVMKSNCTEYDKQFGKVKQSTKMQQYDKEYENLYEFLTKNTGSTVNNIEAVESLYNTLEIYELNNLTLPHWLNNSLMNQMKNIAAENLAIYSETEYMKKMKGGFFLKTILDLMEVASVGIKDIPTINIYSGHDLTIVHVLRALKLIDTIKPDFGASIILELYDNFLIKVFYSNSWNGQPLEQVLTECSSPCSINKFKNSYKAILPLNWFKECQS